MFTGIIEEVGEIQSIKKGANSAVITIKASTVLGDLHLGDSVALNGDRKSTRLNSSHSRASRMPSSA